AIFAPHPTYTAFDFFMQETFRSKYQAACVADKGFATTFDNRTFPAHFQNNWYVLMAYMNRNNYYNNNFNQYLQQNKNQHSYRDYNEKRFYSAVLARDNSHGQKELKVVLNNGEYEFNFEPASQNAGFSNSFSASNPAAKVQFNKEEQHVQYKYMNDFFDKNGKIFAQFYALPDGTIRFFAPQAGLEFFYDGARVKFQAASQYRGAVRGICGTYSNQYADDFTSPKNCVMRNP
ncbi:VWD domain-containing protein, partial [Bacillus anthracis]|nr:VWD domain-containing protein [Bacillus anthracis]